MKIKAKLENGRGNRRTVYYKHTTAAGKPIFGSRNDAAEFPPETAQKVLAHLKVIDSRCAAAELE